VNRHRQWSTLPSPAPALTVQAVPTCIQDTDHVFAAYSPRDGSYTNRL
jgi:hypothetical protein